MFAVLYIADFALHAVLRLEAGSGGKPAALLDDTSRKAVIVACNDSARVEGVDAGQTAAQALAHCDGLPLHTRRPAAEAEAQAVLLAAAFALSPKVEATAPGTCTVNVRGLDAARRRALLHASVRRLLAADLPATGGMAATPLLALYAARSECCAASPSVTIIDDPAAFLGPLPVAAADPEPELAEVLGAWGVHTLGQLTALPKVEVARRLGPSGLALWERAAGETTRVLRVVSPPKQFVATMEFEHEVETLEPLLFILRRFVDRLAWEIEAAHLAAIQLICKLKLVDDTAYTRSFRLPEPTQKADMLFHVLHTHLEQLRTESPIAAVGLRIKAGRSPVRQRGLFETELNDPHGFAETLARVGALLPGKNNPAAVGTPYVPDSHRPDTVVMETPPTVVPPAQPSASRLLPLGLPLRRFRPPLAARVMLEDDRPASVWSQRVQGVIVDRRGPWFGAGDWWEEGRAWEREEWDVELSGGGLYRVIHTPTGWFVEGEYD